jgi:transcriptional regulator GlxA family with amidase domain
LWIGASQLDQATLLVVGGTGALKPITPSLGAWLRQRAKRVRRIGSICTGAFILAEAGLLKNRRAVTHWQFCAEFSRRHPDVKLEMNPIFIKDENVYTSAGVSAGIDLALTLAEEDWGFSPANIVARYLVLFMRRGGDQAQYSTVLSEQERVSEPGFRNLPAWTMTNLHCKLDVDALAKFVSMSRRTFLRRFPKQFGMSPGQWIRALRVEAARDRLESTTDGLKQIARVAGFGNELSLRRAFIAVRAYAPRAPGEGRDRHRTGAHPRLTLSRQGGPCESDTSIPAFLAAPRQSARFEFSWEGIPTPLFRN